MPVSLDEIRSAAARLQRDAEALAKAAERHTAAPCSSVAGLSDAEILRIAHKAVELYAIQHPRPPHVNQKQAAEMLHVSARTVHNMLKAGTLNLNRCGMIPIEQIDMAQAIRRP